MKQTFNESITSPRIICFLAIPVLIAFAFLVYSNIFNSPFYFDDFHNIQDNAHIRMSRISWDSINDVLNSPSQNRPLANLTFALNYYFDAYNVQGFHLLNLIIHILTGIFVFLFFADTLKIYIPDNIILPDKKRIFIAFSASLIWLVHPVNTQAVTYIVQRMTSMASMFYILAFLFYLKSRLAMLVLANDSKPHPARTTSRPYIFIAGSILSGIFALTSKETAATLPVLIFIYEWFFFQNLNPQWLKKNILYISGVILLFAAIGLIFLGGNPLDKIHSLYVATLSIQNFTLTERLLTEIRVLLFYISLFFFPNPSRLHLDYIYPISHSLTDPITTLICLFAVSGLLILTVYSAKKHRILSFCILWFFGNLIIESSFIGLAPIYEHRTYLPFIMLSLITVLLINTLIRKKWVAFALIGLIICLFSAGTCQRNSTWLDRSIFWQDNITKSPSNPRPLITYGNILLNNGEIEAAIEQYKKAFLLKTDYNQIYISLGDAYALLEKFDIAIEYYLKGLLISPQDVEILNKLGNALVRKGKTDKAIAYFTQALNINNNDAATYNNLGAAFFHQSQFDSAVSNYLSAIEIQPDYPEAQINLALALTKQGKINKAIFHYKKAILLAPDNGEAYKNLANLFFNQNNYDEAILHYQKALAINPEDAQTQFNLGIAFYNQSDINASIQHIRKALIIKPGYVQAKNALLQLKSMQQNSSKSR